MEADHFVLNQKTLLRSKMRAQRQALAPEFCQKAALAIARHANAFLKRDARLAVYWAYGSELNLFFLIQKALQKKARVFLPQILLGSRSLYFVQLRDVRNHPSSSYFLEKPSHRYPLIYKARRLDVIFVPLIAVDKEGYRLGQGGGFYDATLSFRELYATAQKPLVIGASYDCQRVGEVPHALWDVRLDAVITECGLRWFVPR